MDFFDCFRLFWQLFTFFEFFHFFGPFSWPFSTAWLVFFQNRQSRGEVPNSGFFTFSDFFDGFGPFLTWFIPGKRRFCRFWSFSTFLAHFQHFLKVYYPKKRRSENHRRTYRIELNFAPKLDLDERNSPSEFHWKRSRFTDFRPFQSFRQIGLNLGSICCWRYLTLLYLADYRPQENISVPYISILLSTNITYLCDRLKTPSCFLVARLPRIVNYSKS